MLKISENSINNKEVATWFKSFERTNKMVNNRSRSNWLIISFFVVIAIQFLPWTQTTDTSGYVTTRSPEDRPHSIQSVIDGRIEKWFVQEGDFVKKGDTIAFLSEVKGDYFDPNLLERAQEQVEAKDLSVKSYDFKIQALDLQYEALIASKKAKLNQVQNKFLQTKNKVAIDSVDLEALEKELEITHNQTDRTQSLYDQGLKTLSDLQKKQIKLQQLDSKVKIQGNKLANRKAELSQMQIELGAVRADYANKLAKSRSDKQSAMSNKLDAKVKASKLKNTFENYTRRQSLYHVTANQSGFIARVIQKGTGEIVKSGSTIATIVPDDMKLAVVTKVKPRDLPLMRKGHKVSLRFDGYPSIQLSGWPTASVGIFYGLVDFVDPSLSKEGYYRVIIVPDKEDRPWPDNLSVGIGTDAYILLDDVSIWYEIWRQLNGFPQNYYKLDTQPADEKVKK